MTYKTYNNDIANKVASRLGLLVTGFWVISFLIVVINFPGWFSELGYFFGLLSIWFVGKNLRNMRRFVMPMSWVQGFTMCLLAFMGGTLLTTFIQYLYFAYVDHGSFITAMQQSLSDPAMVKMMTQSGNKDLLVQMTEMMKRMTEMTPRELTIQLFTTNATLAFFFSLIASLFGGKEEKIQNP